MKNQFCFTARKTFLTQEFHDASLSSKKKKKKKKTNTNNCRRTNSQKPTVPSRLVS